MKDRNEYPGIYVPPPDWWPLNLTVWFEDEAILITKRRGVLVVMYKKDLLALIALSPVLEKRQSQEAFILQYNGGSPFIWTHEPGSDSGEEMWEYHRESFLHNQYLKMMFQCRMRLGV